MKVYWPPHSKWYFANFSFTKLVYDCLWKKEFMLECDGVTDAWNKERAMFI